MVGSNRLNSTAGPAQWRRILGEIYVHPQFNEVKRVHDLAAFRIEPVTLPNLQPVKLNDQPSNPVVSQWVTVAGYGETETPNIQTKYLRKAQLKIFDNDICKATHEYLDPLVADMDMTAMLCASGASSTKRGPSYGTFQWRGRDRSKHVDLNCTGAHLVYETSKQVTRVDH